MVVKSVGERPKRSVPAPRIAAAAIGTPMSNPSAKSRKLSRSTSITICVRVEPSDKRIPISVLRLIAR
jgi:hypothetical protein